MTSASSCAAKGIGFSRGRISFATHAAYVLNPLDGDWHRVSSAKDIEKIAASVNPDAPNTVSLGIAAIPHIATGRFSIPTRPTPQEMTAIAAWNNPDGTYYWGTGTPSGAVDTQLARAGGHNLISALDDDTIGHIAGQGKDPYMLGELAEHSDDIGVLGLVAGNRHTGAETLDILAGRNIESLHQAIVTHPNVSVRTLMTLTFDQIAERLVGPYAEHDITLEAITEHNDPRIADVAAFDARIFGEQQPLSTKAFTDIIDAEGVIIAVRDHEGEVICESHMMLDANRASTSRWERRLPADVAHSDGAAVEQDMHDMGLEKLLGDVQEEVARAKHKHAISVSERPNNIRSIKTMLAAGYVIAGHAPHYDGDTPAGSRVVLLKLLDRDERPDYPKQEPVEVDSVPQAIAQRTKAVTISAAISDSVDDDLDQTIASLVGNGYIAVGSDTTDAGGDTITFLRVDSLDDGLADVYIKRQIALKRLFAT